MKNLISKEEKDQIDLICKKYTIQNYLINADGSIDVDGDVEIYNKNITVSPLVFNIVTGDFAIEECELTSLEGFPRTVGGNFDCSNNKLTSLENGPKKVSGNFYCSRNNLTSLVGLPVILNHVLNCSRNNLTSLKGSPTTVGGYYSCSDNNLTSLVGGPVTVGGDFNCEENNLTSLEGSPTTIGHDMYCSLNQLSSTYSGNIDIEVGGEITMSHNILPESLLRNIDHINLILKYQRHFEIWNNDLTLNDENFQILLDEIKDGLE